MRLRDGPAKEESMTHYTARQLKHEAVVAVRDDAKAAGVKARCLGYTLELHQLNHGQGTLTVLVAHGQRQNDGVTFDVRVAI